MTTLAMLVQWVHVVGGAIWFGGQFVVAVALWPALLRRPAPEARDLYHAVGRTLGPLMAASGITTILLGLVRGTLLGPVRSWASLVESEYGRLLVASLVLTVAVGAWGGVTRARLDAEVWPGGAYAPAASRYVKKTAAVTVAGFVAILGCMVGMRFGG